MNKNKAHLYDGKVVNFDGDSLYELATNEANGREEYWKLHTYASTAYAIRIGREVEWLEAGDLVEVEMEWDEELEEFSVIEPDAPTYGINDELDELVEDESNFS